MLEYTEAVSVAFQRGKTVTEVTLCNIHEDLDSDSQGANPGCPTDLCISG